MYNAIIENDYVGGGGLESWISWVLLKYPYYFYLVMTECVCNVFSTGDWAWQRRDCSEPG